MFSGRRLPVYGGLGVTSSCRRCRLVPGVLVSRSRRCDVVADDLLSVVVVDSLLLLLFVVISLFTQQTHSYRDSCEGYTCTVCPCIACRFRDARRRTGGNIGSRRFVVVWAI